MIFGEYHVDEAEGVILAHSVALKDGRLAKGHVLTSTDLQSLLGAGHRSVVGGRLETGDVLEDEAAARLAKVIAGDQTHVDDAFTGRANIRAECDGVVLVDRARIDRMNVVDEAITIATVDPFGLAQEGQLVATVKIIPLAVPERALKTVTEIAKTESPVVSVAPFLSKKVTLIHTLRPGLKPITVEKSEVVMKKRIERLGSNLAWQTRVDHNTSDISKAIGSALERGCDLILLFGATAIADRADIIPQSIVAADGAIDHFGIPVDPGNLLLLAHVGAVPVVGLPGCARSPKQNGLDFILARLCADVPISSRDLMHLGAGGLLKEIPARPQPREISTIHSASSTPHRNNIAAIVLAAGLSSRMGPDNKLLSDYGGQPLIAHVVEQIRNAHLERIVVVTGHEANDVRNALTSHNVEFVENPDFAEGLSSSLRAGLRRVTNEVDGAIVCLGDMPLITAEEINKLIEAFAPEDDHAICVPTHDGKQGNPVLWSNQFFDEMLSLKGDIGAKSMIAHHEELVCEVPMPNEAALIDVDTQEALRSLKEREQK